MLRWPRSAIVSVLLLIAIALAAPIAVYKSTRAAYHAVGINDGQIGQRQEIMDLIQKSVLVADCRTIQTPNVPIEFLTVKANSLYLIPIDGKTVAFCS
ncbi:hypothetical protein [Taklimakanibacter albus]|uniref:Uncharacterized protein n=1 Tax=Taklimakanibacter albus TaxID=2800327 RepID=A0ACC5RBD5_9HYPH|nr:hypothetical protein [Aestuariivirga sp. YIM B02566]MBK1869952.1 hypothetical protein [Aestuariivirga sp. YIM B02566]